ncbi:MAG: hypothetical protein AABZ47_11980 [Planctomycetota bacterium]
MISRQVVLTVLLTAGTCRFQTEPTQSRLGPASNTDRSPSETPSSDTTPGRNALPDPNVSDHWLRVLAVQKNAPGAYAKGSFDRDRNRIEIRTRDVMTFAVDISKIKIDWSRPVVIRIDGVSSELRRREHPVLHFHWDEHGAWTVVEPPKPGN